MVDIITGVVAGGLGLVGSLFQSKSADKAAAAVAGSADQASATQWAMYQQTREDMAPWRIAGTKALGTLENKLEAGPGEFKPSEDPGYRFGYEEFVEKPTLRMASATGKLGSGATQKALTRYASDYASTKYDNFLNRWYQSLTPYQSLSGLGQTTATQGGALGAETGANIGKTTLAGGQARETGYVNQANIWGNLAGGAGQNMLDYKMYEKMGLFK